MYLCSYWVRTRAARVISVIRPGLAVTCWRAPQRWVSKADLRSPRERRSRSGLGHQREQSSHRLVRDPGRLGLLSLPQARSDDPPNAVPGRRLDPLLLEVRQQLGPYPVDLALLLTRQWPATELPCPRPRPSTPRTPEYLRMSAR
jgi:hypothetical protein